MLTYFELGICWNLQPACFYCISVSVMMYRVWQTPRPLRINILWDFTAFPIIFSPLILQHYFVYHSSVGPVDIHINQFHCFSFSDYKLSLIIKAPETRDKFSLLRNYFFKKIVLNDKGCAILKKVLNVFCRIAFCNLKRNYCMSYPSQKIYIPSKNVSENKNI